MIVTSRNSFIFTGLAALCLATAAQAAVVTSSNAAWPVASPAETWDVFGTGASAYWNGVAIRSTRIVRQTFQADSSFTLGGIVLSARGYDGDLSFSVKIYQVTNINGSTWSATGATQIGSTIIVAAPGSSFDQPNVNANLSISLTPSEQVFLAQRNTGTLGYALEFRPYDTTSMVFEARHSTDGIDHSEGHYYFSDGTNDIIPGATYDLGLALIPVPEPATLSLFGLGALCIAGRRRGRRDSQTRDEPGKTGVSSIGQLLRQEKY